MQSAAIDYISVYANYLMAIIPAVAALRVAILAYKKSVCEDEDMHIDYNHKIKRTFIAAVAAISVSAIVSVIRKYY